MAAKSEGLPALIRKCIEIIFNIVDESGNLKTDESTKNPLLALALLAANACEVDRKTGRLLTRVVMFDDSPAMCASGRNVTEEVCEVSHGRTLEILLSALEGLVRSGGEAGVLCFDWGECLGVMESFDIETGEAVYGICGGAATVDRINTLKHRGWYVAWTSNDSNEALVLYDEVARKARLKFDIRANGEHVHDFRIDVLCEALRQRLGIPTPDASTMPPQWRCDQCTLVNAPDVEVCPACREPKPEKGPIAPTSVSCSDADLAGWARDRLVASLRMFHHSNGGAYRERFGTMEPDDVRAALGVPPVLTRREDVLAATWLIDILREEPQA